MLPARTQLEQLLERRRLLVLRGEHLLERRHLAGHTQGHGDFGEADRSSIRRSANDVWGKGPPELPCGGWEGRPTHARGEGACSRSCAGRPGVSRVTPLRHVGTHTPQRLSLLLELDVGLGHSLGEIARAARLLQQRQQVRAV